MNASTHASSFTIGDRRVGDHAPIYLIAEAGVAHFGDLDKAMRLVDLAADAAADAVKFQMFRADDLICSASPEWRDRLRSRELPLEAFARIRDHCVEKGITFLSTAHDESGLEALLRLDPPAFKIGSGEVGNSPFIRKIAGLGKPVILSTGMYEEGEIDRTLGLFTQAGNGEVALLHCVTLYPTPPESVNLAAMVTMRRRFGVVTGYSDHTRGRHFPLAAAALGARIIEKHITLDFDVPNAQDWKVSCGPGDLSLLVAEIREIEAGLGSGRKAPAPGEEQSLAWARKSLVLARALPAGATVTAEMVVMKRPGTGIPPDDLPRVAGRRLARALPADTLLLWEHLL